MGSGPVMNRPYSNIPDNNFQQLSRYEDEPLAVEAIDGGYALGVMQEISRGAPGLSTPYLSEIPE